MNDQQDRRYDLAEREDLTPFERAQIKRLLPQIEDLLETHRRQKWLLKSIGMFLLAFPAVAGFWQGILKLVEWIKSP